MKNEKVNAAIINGFVTVIPQMDLAETMEAADKCASYCQSNLYLRHDGSYYCRQWCGSRDGIADCENPLDYGDFGYFGDWTEIEYNRLNAEMIMEIDAAISKAE